MNETDRNPIAYSLEAKVCDTRNSCDSKKVSLTNTGEYPLSILNSDIIKLIGNCLTGPDGAICPQGENDSDINGIHDLKDVSGYMADGCNLPFSGAVDCIKLKPTDIENLFIIRYINYPNINIDGNVNNISIVDFDKQETQKDIPDNSMDRLMQVIRAYGIIPNFGGD